MKKAVTNLKRKDHSIKTRIDDQSMKALAKKASAEGVTVSEIVRRAIRLAYLKA